VANESYLYRFSILHEMTSSSEAVGWVPSASAADAWLWWWWAFETSWREPDSLDLGIAVAKSLLCVLQPVRIYIMAPFGFHSCIYISHSFCWVILLLCAPKLSFNVYYETQAPPTPFFLSVSCDWLKVAVGVAFINYVCILLHEDNIMYKRTTNRMLSLPYNLPSHTHTRVLL
jgi:hypothetical protein